MDRVMADLLDDDYLPTDGEDIGPDLSQEPTEVGVRYLLDLGMTEMDARHMVALAKGEIGQGGRPNNAAQSERRG